MVRGLKISNINKGYQCWSDTIRTKEILSIVKEEDVMLINVHLKLWEMSEYFLLGMTDFSGGSDVSARLFRRI